MASAKTLWISVISATVAASLITQVPFVPSDDALNNAENQAGIPSVGASSTMPLGPKLQGPKPAKTPSGLAGTASISVENGAVRSGGQFAIDVRFHCNRGSMEVYDPFFCAADTTRASLRVFDAISGQFVGDGLSVDGVVGCKDSHWLKIQEGSIVGRTLLLKTGDRTDLSLEKNSSGDGRTMIVRLGPGKYRLQFVLLGRFLDVHVAQVDGPVARPGVPGAAEIYHSNVVDVEVTPRS